MEFAKRYKQYTEMIVKEHEAVFQKQDTVELHLFIIAIKEAERIFITGAGREGIAARGLAMRIMHLGKPTFWLWDDTTPGMREGDLFLVVNGSGKIGHIDYLMEQAKSTGAEIGVITGAPFQLAPQTADYQLFVPACVYKGTDQRVVPSAQPMGNLFEQHLFLLFDLIAMMLGEEMNCSMKEMERRHRNIE